eukprot:364496-Chlamydomonas_euryale.AAC.28
MSMELRSHIRPAQLKLLSQPRSSRRSSLRASGSPSLFFDERIMPQTTRAVGKAAARTSSLANERHASQECVCHGCTAAKMCVNT